MVFIKILSDNNDQENHKQRSEEEEVSFFERPSTSAQNVIGLNTYQLELMKVEHSPSINKRYIYSKKLSDGSASKLYIAQDTISNKEVIIKKISKKEDWRSELRLLKILKKNNAQNLLTYLDFYENYRFAYIVTSYFNGFDLFEHIDINVPYSEHNAKELFMKMMQCTLECHKLDIAHLDIKCENYIYKDRKLILIDFGHAELMSSNLPKELIKTKYVIKKGSSNYGTCFYLAPEGYHRFYSMYSDIWSLGICFYLLLTGEYPFAGDDDEYSSNVYKGLIHFSTKVPDDALYIIKWCLNYDPRLRPTIYQLMDHKYFRY